MSSTVSSYGHVCFDRIEGIRMKVPLYKKKTVKTLLHTCTYITNL